MQIFALAMVALLTGLPTAKWAAKSAAKWEPREGRELLGRPAPAWQGLTWIQGGPLTIEGLRGKVVLIRFWLSGCPLCARTAPALEELHERYGARGLVVVGIHHPKSDDARDPAVVANAARELGMHFPIAHDDEWRTVRAYGVGTVFKSYTSVSLLIDRDGIIRFVHDGGEYHRGGGREHRDCNAAYDALVSAIERALTSTKASSARTPLPSR